MERGEIPRRTRHRDLRCIGVSRVCLSTIGYSSAFAKYAADFGKNTNHV